jgi:hypothetical protein
MKKLKAQSSKLKRNLKLKAQTIGRVVSQSGSFQLRSFGLFLSFEL